MKNITLSIEEKVLATVRQYAARHNSSVNRLVREYLTQIAERDSQAKDVRKRLRQLSQRSTARMGSRPLNRNSLHER